MSNKIYVAGIMQSNTFADHELLLKNKYFLGYRAGSKNNNKNRIGDQSTYSFVHCLNIFTLFFFYFSLVYKILEPSFSPLVQQIFISCITYEPYH